MKKRETRKVKREPCLTGNWTFLALSLQASYATHQQQTASRRRAWARHSLQFSLINPPVEKDWTAAVKTSVDWKSLVTPALLPLTTNYYPDKRTLNTSYLEYNYELLIDFDEDYGLAAERMRLMNQRQERFVAVVWLP